MLQLFSANENKESKTGGLEPHVLLIHNTIKYFYVKQRGIQIQIVVSWFNTFSSTPLFLSLPEASIFRVSSLPDGIRTFDAF